MIPLVEKQPAGQSPGAVIMISVVAGEPGHVPVMHACRTGSPTVTQRDTAGFWELCGIEPAEIMMYLPGGVQ